MTRYPRLHRSLILLGAIQSFVLGAALLLDGAFTLSLFLRPETLQQLGFGSTVTSNPVAGALSSFAGALILFYAFVMVAVSLRFDRRSIRVKACGELVSGALFLWIVFFHHEIFRLLLLVPLTIQHAVVGTTYFLTTRGENSQSEPEKI